MPKMRAIQVPGPRQSFELVEKEIPTPTRGTVRIKIQACGICHSDSFTKEGTFPNILFPRVPGHEVAGIIDALGADVILWKVGQRVGVGWHGGHCGQCEACRKGDFICCTNLQIPGITYDGGYADYMIAPVEALALIPDELSAMEAGPLMCAGITTFNALRHCGAKPGDVVAILGIGGLGHLALQFSAKMGFNTIAIARGSDKEAFVKKLGARHYIDSEKKNVAEELQKLGSAKAVIATVTSSKAIEPLIDGLSVNGNLILLGAAIDSFQVFPLKLIMARRTITGWPSGTSQDSQDTLNFSAQTGVRSMNHTFPLEKAAEAYDFMMSGKARFRVVLVTGQ